MGQILSILWEIALISWEILVFRENLFNVSKNLGMSEKFIWPLKWYTDRNFFGDGGGGRPKKFFPEKHFWH
jgi:hypothetical protein